MNGPTQVIIPEQRYLSCMECDFYSHVMLKSGFNPVYGQFCSNPDLPEEKKQLSPVNWSGNLISDRTPEWCPILVKRKKDAEKELLKPLEFCHAGKDGECNHPNCPQLRDNEPYKSGRSCPLPDHDEEYY